LSDSNKLSLSSKIFIGLLCGIFAGWLLAQMGESAFVDTILGALAVIKSLFVNALKMMVVPLVLVSLICGTASLSDPKQLGSIGGKSLLLYLCTTAIAISMSLFFANLVNPGAGVVSSGAEFSGASPQPLSQVLGGLVAANPIQAMASGNMLQVIVFAILMGLAMSAAGESGQRVASFFNDLNNVILKLVTLIMNLAPMGVFAIMTLVIHDLGLQAITNLATYFVLMVVLLLGHMSITYSLLVAIAGLNPKTLLLKMRPAMLFAFSTSSSAATLPVTMEVARKRLGIGRSTASFCLPLGATVNMDGTAIMQGLATVFIANMAGVDLHFSQYLTIILMSTLASIGTAAVPAAGLVTLTMVLTQVNLPTEAIGMLLGVDRLLDMVRTTVNVTGDVAVSSVVAKMNGDLDRAIYDDPNAGLDFENDKFQSIKQV
jgi:Na+/H+-dicarboxylate symporter